MKKRILIGCYDNNNNHKSLNIILYEYLNKKNLYDIKIIDLIDYSSNLGKINNKIKNLTKKNTLLFKINNLFNNKVESLNINFNKLCSDIQEYNPHLIISTNYLFSYLCKEITKSIVISIINNYNSYKRWIKSNSDYFIVNNELIKNIMLKNNVNKNKILTYGIPVNKDNIITNESKESILKKYSLNSKLPIYLFFAGGTVGYNYTFDYLKDLTKKELPIFIIYLTGNNKELKKKCEEYIYNNNIKNVLVLGYIKNISDIFKVSDVIITKPGTDTLNECLILKKPSILINSLNIEEENNKKFMIKNHYSIKANKNISRKVSLFLNYPFILNSIQNKLNKLNNNNSLEDIYIFINKKLK